MSESKKLQRLDELLREAATVRAPLPDRLAHALRSIPDMDKEGSGPPPDAPWPRTPMPPDLRRRLVEIPRRPILPLPRWLAEPRWVVAASLLLAVLMGAVVGGPERLGFQLAETTSHAERVARDAGRTAWTQARTDFEYARERISTEIRLPSNPWKPNTGPEDRETP